MQKAETWDGLTVPFWSVGFCGQILDDRGRAAVEAVKAHTGRILELSYDSDNFTVDCGERTVCADEFIDTLRQFRDDTIVLESTTLGFVEILLTCMCLRKLGVEEVHLIYVEPGKYSSPRWRQLLHRRDFELSGLVPGYTAIPGAAMLLADRASQKGIFFLGYEERRLERAFEDLQMIQASRAAVVFGIPAFRPGWEMDAIANNIEIIREQNIRGGVYFCGAENPLAVIEILGEFHRGLESDERLFVAPIGTKPHGIGVALFVAEHADVRVIFDHPRRTEGRSDGIGHWHLYKADFAGR
jgi:hypothetical protein